MAPLPDSDGAHRLRPAGLVVVAVGGLLLVFGVALVVGAGIGENGSPRSGDLSAVQAPVALGRLSDEPTSTATPDPMDPAAGCPTPSVTVDEAQEAAVGEASFDGVIKTPFELVWSQYMSWDAYAWAYEEGPSYPVPGCVWAVELHGLLLFNNFPPYGSRVPTPQPAEMTVIHAAVDGATGHVVHSSMGPYSSAHGTPMPTRPPPPSGWPTVEPLDPDRLMPPPGDPMPTPAPPWFSGEPATPTP